MCSFLTKKGEVEKQTYFTVDNIDKLSEKWLYYLSKFKKRHSVFISNPALLILDMQGYFLSRDSHAFIPSSSAILPKVLNLIEAFKTFNLPIFFTRHIDKSDYSPMIRWWRGSIKRDDPLSEINKDIFDKDSIIIEKSQYDAFYETELESILKTKNIDQLIVAGVATHLCCETTIRSAFIRGFQIFFPIDSTATFNKQFHLATFINLSHGFSIPTTTKEIVRYLGVKYAKL